MGLIHDITPAYQRGYGMSRRSSDSLVTALYRRGVTIEEIFGIYYALEEQASARDDEIFGNDEQGQHGKLTVGDAQLALGIAPIKYNQPF